MKFEVNQPPSDMALDDFYDFYDFRWFLWFLWFSIWICNPKKNYINILAFKDIKEKLFGRTKVTQFSSFKIYNNNNNDNNDNIIIIII